MKTTKEVLAFLERETPSDGGCMLCEVTYKDFPLNVIGIMPEKKVFFLIERLKTPKGDVFTFNNRFFYNYEHIWEKTQYNKWEIIFKRNVN